MAHPVDKRNADLSNSHEETAQKDDVDKRGKAAKIQIRRHVYHAASKNSELSLLSTDASLVLAVWRNG